MDIKTLMKSKKAEKRAEERKAKVEPDSGEQPEARRVNDPMSGQLAGSIDTAIPPVQKEGPDRTAMYVDIRNIQEDFQIRNLIDADPEAYSEESIRRLALVIKADDAESERNIADPIILHRDDEGKLWLREGKRRTLACTMLAEELGVDAWYFQPAKIRHDRASEDIELLQFNLNNTKEAVDLPTTIAFLKKKTDSGMQQKELAKLTGYSTARISKLLKVATLPNEIQSMIYAGDLPYQGRTLDKALREYNANVAELEAQDDFQETEVNDTSNVVDGLVEQSTRAEKPDDQPSSPNKATENQTQKTSKKADKLKAKPVVKAPKKSISISLEQEIVKKLYQVVVLTRFVSGLDETLVDLNDEPNRKAMLETVKDVDDLVDHLTAKANEDAAHN